MDTNLTVGAPRGKSVPPSRASSRRTASAVHILGVCGLLSAAFSAAAGLLGVPMLLGIAPATMVAGNVYAIVGGWRRRWNGR